jgi:hypothetical protein
MTAETHNERVVGRGRWKAYSACGPGKAGAASASTCDCALRSVDESSRDPSHVVSAALAGVRRGL